jgi:hypothetical protein
MARLDETRQTFDYDKLLSISTGWDGCIYCLAPETAYLAGLNLERFTNWRRRWHHTNGDALTDGEWDNAQAIVAQGVYELMAGCDTLGSDIKAGLETLAAAISAQSGGGGGGGCYPQNAVIECIINLPNEELLGPGEYEQGDPEVDPPPDGFATWEEYFAYKCQAANFIWWLERKHMANLRSLEGIAALASLVGPGIAGLAGLLPAAFTPAGFAVFVASVVAIGLLSLTSWFFMDEMIQWWDDNREDIVCALYNSGTSVGAVAALGNFLEDAIQAIVTWGALEAVAGAIAELLGTAFSQLAGNGIVAPLFAATASVVSVEGAIDCSVCEEPTEGCYTFDDDMQGFENFLSPPPTCGVAEWVSQGHLAGGSIHLQIEAGCDTAVARKQDPWQGPVVSQGDVISCYVKSDVPDTTNFVFDVFFTDDTNMQDYIISGTFDWSLLEITVDAGHAGKTIKEIWLSVNKGLNMATRQAWYDEVCYVPA